MILTPLGRGLCFENQRSGPILEFDRGDTWVLGSLSDLGVLQLVSGGLQVWELPIAQPQHLPEERALRPHMH